MKDGEFQKLEEDIRPKESWKNTGRKTMEVVRVVVVTTALVDWATAATIYRIH